MKRIRILAGQLLIAANIFIAFLLLFESRLVIPVWLQPIGRMHPLVLHFPIVLVILAMCLNFFRYSKPAANEFYPGLSKKLLLAGALLTAITVIMGLFLSKEEGYQGDTLQWHKWTGVFTFFSASLIYWIQNLKWYKPFVRKISSLAVVCILILAGHFGAALTHGEDFIMQPLAVTKETPVVPIEQAVLFDHLIKPVFEKKCAACHKPGKMKGELSLMDSASIVKGGKTGKLFIPGDIVTSLLLERIHLPAEEKKHMPPAGKPQLTEQEAKLIRLWIASNAYFTKPVTELPENDSLRLLASQILQPASGDVYNFPPADEKTIIALNDNYRTIRPIAMESPALSVDMYNAATYQLKRLEELSSVKRQVVSLNLNKLPVKDEDLKSIRQLENIRKLELNFTNVTVSGLKELVPLQYLQTIALSGTKLNYQGLKDQLPAFKSLRKIIISNAGLSDAEAEQLQKDNSHITIVAGFKNSNKDTLMLNPPQVKSLMVFDQQLPLQLKHVVKGVEIRFTTDGSQPDSIHSILYDGTTVLNNTTRIHAKAYKSGWYASDIAVFDFLKCSLKPDSVELLFPFEHRHLADGPSTFFDKKLGIIEPNNSVWANNWAGARENDMAILCRFKKPVTVSNIGLHYMCEEVNGIYPPGEVEVWGGDDEKKLKLLIKIKTVLPVKDEKASLKLTEGQCKPQTVSFLKIVAKPYQKKGSRYLLLVDEMFIN